MVHTLNKEEKNFKIPKGKVAEDLTLEECLEIIEKDSKATKKSARKASKTTTKKTTKKE